MVSFDVLMFCDAVNVFVIFLVCFLFNKYFTDSSGSSNIVCYKNHLVLLVIDYTFKE